MTVELASNSISPSSPDTTCESVKVPGRVDHMDRSESTCNTIAYWLMQISHRIGAVSLLATLCTWAMMYKVQNVHWPLAIAAGASDVGLCSALLARMFVRHNTRFRRESSGVAIFNLVLFILSLYCIVIVSLPVIRENAATMSTQNEQR